MKKFSLLLAMLMVFSLCACSTDKPEAAETPAPTESVSKVDTCILIEEDENMINNYSLLAVNPDAPFTDADGNAVTDVKINTVGAQALIEWMLSEASELIAGYGVEEYGDKLFYLKDDAPKYDGKIAAANDETKLIRLSTTTSVNDSGLLDYLLPVFEKEYGYKVEVQSAGTGKAIAAAKYGNADLILVHSKKQEEAFVSEGFSYTLPGFDSERLCFMYNYFVLCGPSDDPAGVKDCDSVRRQVQIHLPRRQFRHAHQGAFALARISRHKRRARELCRLHRLVHLGQCRHGRLPRHGRADARLHSHRQGDVPHLRCQQRSYGLIDILIGSVVRYFTADPIFFSGGKYADRF